MYSNILITNVLQYCYNRCFYCRSRLRKGASEFVYKMKEFTSLYVPLSSFSEA